MSPKSQEYPTAKVERLVVATINGAYPDAGVTTKLATGSVNGAGPKLTWILTVEPTATSVPAEGIWLITTPAPTDGWNSLSTIDVSPAAAREAIASASSWATTLGTGRSEVADTVIRIVDGSESPPMPETLAVAVNCPTLV